MKFFLNLLVRERADGEECLREKQRKANFPFFICNFNLKCRILTQTTLLYKSMSVIYQQTAKSLFLWKQASLKKRVQT